MCGCIEEVDKKLADRPDLNTRLSRAWNLETGQCSVVLLTKKLDDKVRRKPVELYPSFCPFCGEPYPKPQPKTDQA